MDLGGQTLLLHLEGVFDECSSNGQAENGVRGGKPWFDAIVVGLKTQSDSLETAPENLASMESSICDAHKDMTRY